MTVTLIVCPLSQVEAVVSARRPSHVISLLDPPCPIEPLAGYGPERHLRLGVYDITEARDGMTPPEEATVRSILDIGATWDHAQPLLVHCRAGVSRSTATAFILACERSPEIRERDIAFALRQASRTAFPNPCIVALADDMLRRQGRMVDAARSIGRGEACWEGRPFDLPGRFQPPLL